MAKKAKKKTVRKTSTKKKVTKKVAKKAPAKRVAKPQINKNMEAAALFAKTIKELRNEIMSLREDLGADIQTLLRGQEDIMAKFKKVVSAFPANTDLSPNELLEMSASNGSTSYSIEDVKQALQEVSATDGMPAVKALLADFGADRVSDLQEKDYPALIESCKPAPVNTTPAADSSLDLFS